MQNLIDTFLIVIKKLESENIPYMVVGSVAAMVYGEPRMTHDMDIVIDLLPQNSKKLEQLFSPEEFYCPPLEVLKAETTHRGQFNLIHHQSGLKIDLMIRKLSDHATEEFQRRRKVPFWQGTEIYLASPEDIILKKLDFYRQGGSEKHISDIRGILTESEIDKPYLEKWIRELGLEREWKLLQ